VSAGVGFAEKRVALVIGNGGYQHANKPANPVNDARRMREALASLGHMPNTSSSTMPKAITS
jgi:hypothetical protein